jgi:glycosyltransferase involved in cell wall biosynthesis
MTAYACDPGKGSEAGAGWAWPAAAAEHHEVWLVTRSTNRQSIEKALQDNPRPKLHPVYVDLPEWARTWKRGARGLYPYYLIWQLLARRRIRQLHAKVRFDVGHHITFATDWLPAGVAFIPGLPVVWGPVGPGMSAPLRMWRSFGLRWLLQEAVRGGLTAGGSALFGRPTARRASIVVAQNRETAARYAWHPHVVVEQHVALEADLSAEALPAPGRNRRAVFVARLLPWKGLNVAIRALAEPEGSGWHLEVYGAGPERERAERFARRCGVSDRVAFRGLVPRTEVLSSLQTADAMLFPSSHESAGWAVAEAISAGCPVVCFDLGGPGAMLQDGEGIKVRPSWRAHRAFARGLSELGPRHDGSRRWQASRLPALLEAWYASAVAGASGPPALASRPVKTMSGTAR